jgi:hypothetical protein
LADKQIYQYLLSTDGANQIERHLGALDPASVRIDDRSRAELIDFILKLSTQIRFYDLFHQPNGNWLQMWSVMVPGGIPLSDEEIALAIGSRSDLPAHVALLFAFLRVYQQVQQDLNALTGKRINFYYEDVLRIARRKAIPDQVHVLFEAAKSAQPVLLKADATFVSGKAQNGTSLEYRLDHDIVVTQAQVAQIKSTLRDSNIAGQQILYQADDARQIPLAGLNWAPFGIPQQSLAAAGRVMKQAQLGHVIASPELLLKEGVRRITLTYWLKSRMFLPAGIQLKNAIDIYFTAEEGWVSPDVVLLGELKLDPPGQINPDPELPFEFQYILTLQVELSAGAPPVVPYTEEIHQQNLNTIYAAMRIVVRPESFLQETLSAFYTNSIVVNIKVTGVKDLVVQNDQGVLDPAGELMPFTAFPKIGSNLYIGSKEVFSKNVKSLELALTWLDVPADMPAHYEAYENVNINDNGDFEADLFLLHGKQWKNLTNGTATLFNTVNTALTKVISIGALEFAQAIAPAMRKLDPLEPLFNFDQNTRDGFLRLSLTLPKEPSGGGLNDLPFEAFGHKTFATAYSQRAIQISQGATVSLPNPPYTPVLSSVTLNYESEIQLAPHQPNKIDKYFLLDAFGNQESVEAVQVTLLPAHLEQGALYLGIAQTEGPQIHSLLLQIEEGSTPGVELLVQGNISWSYLAGNEWKVIGRSDILEDRTNGFQKSGLVRVAVGSDITAQHTLMPSGMQWLRASVLQNTSGAAAFIDVHTQAARAVLQLPVGRDQLYEEHLASPLSPDKIAALVTRNISIKKVRQPYTSFGGRAPESDAAYRRRVHERLRHRKRAVTAWDYERLLLEAFPEVFKVKTLPHLDIDNNLAPGHTKIVIVPDWKKRPSGNPLQPKANLSFLKELEEYMIPRSPSQTILHLVNPVYEPMLVDCKIDFNPGFDPGFHADLLNEELTEFLSPWAYDDGEDIVFGGRLPASEIMAFIEGQEYVNHIFDFALYHQHSTVVGGIGEMQIGVDFIVSTSPNPAIGGPGIGKAIGIDFVIGNHVSVASATRPDAILVSSDHHRISAFSAEDTTCVGVQSIGIGQMIIGLDFVVIS